MVWSQRGGCGKGSLSERKQWGATCPRGVCSLQGTKVQMRLQVGHTGPTAEWAQPHYSPYPNDPALSVVPSAQGRGGSPRAWRSCWPCLSPGSKEHHGPCEEGRRCRERRPRRDRSGLEETAPRTWPGQGSMLCPAWPGIPEAVCSAVRQQAGETMAEVGGLGR